MDKDLSYQSATRDVLLTTAKLIGESCVDENLAFTKCKAESSDPEACLELGAAVLACNNRVFAKLKTQCSAEFEGLRKCMDDHQMKFSKCREEEKTLHEAYHKA